VLVLTVKCWDEYIYCWEERCDKYIFIINQCLFIAKSSNLENGVLLKSTLKACWNVTTEIKISLHKTQIWIFSAFQHDAFFSNQISIWFSDHPREKSEDIICIGVCVPCVVYLFGWDPNFTFALGQKSFIIWDTGKEIINFIFITKKNCFSAKIITDLGACFHW